MAGLAEAPAAYRPAKLDKRAMMALIEAGVFENRRVEMIDGMVVEMSPADDPHGGAVFAIGVAFGIEPAPGLKGVSDGALYLSEDLMFAPDITIIPRTLLIEKAKGEDIRLLIEVSDSSLENDLGNKAKLYAAHGVPEYWVVDLEKRKLHRHLDPNTDGYADIAALEWSDPVRPHLIPGCEIRLSEVLDR